MKKIRGHICGNLLNSNKQPSMFKKKAKLFITPPIDATFCRFVDCWSWGPQTYCCACSSLFVGNSLWLTTSLIEQKIGKRLHGYIIENHFFSTSNFLLWLGLKNQQYQIKHKFLHWRKRWLHLVAITIFFLAIVSWRR